jgi:hypothetical protein
VFYSGSRIFDSLTDQGPPPARDVQVILQHDERVGPYFQTGADYYIYRDGRWLGVDIFGLFDFLLDSGLVLFGRTINNDEYQAIYQQAKIDKQTWLRSERQL